ncbi:unnamed protein product [Lasius platythorax]|uniref:C2H2-type domain-containing protein n=1 Tax=Lasius platythorax TaxID=488582 RepID=A0AAV2NMD4_9HYME
MGPRIPNSPVSDLYEDSDIPDGPELVLSYYCHYGFGYSHTIIPAIICTACIVNLIYEKSDKWSLIRFHQLSIRKPIYVICNRCNKNLHVPREDYRCRTCTNKFIEYLIEYSNHRFHEGDNGILVESEKIGKTELY